MSDTEDRTYLCPACKTGIVECICEDDNDEWECGKCTFKVHRGSNLLEMIPALQKAEKKLEELEIEYAMFSKSHIGLHMPPFEQQKYTQAMLEIDRLKGIVSLRSDCRNPNISNGPKE